MWALIFGLFGIAAQPTLADTAIESSIKNRVVSINRVIIIGNKITREKIISRELTLKPGDTISTTRLEKVLPQDQRKIYNLRLFNSVTVRWLEVTQSQVDLLIEVNERWYTFPVPIFELSDRNFNEWWQNYDHDFKRVNYGLRLYQYNFRGRNETLRLTAQFGFTRRFELSYRIPYIDRQQKHGLIFDFNFSEPKNLGYNTEDHKLVFKEGRKVLKTAKGFGVTYTFRRSFYETHSFNFSYQNNHVVDSIAILNPNYYGNDRVNQIYGALTYSFNSEHRDVVAYPLKGYQFTVFAQKVGLGFGTDVSQWEANITYARYFDLTKNFYLSNFSSAYLSTPLHQPYNLYSALGYRKQLVKGYEVYVIEGPKFFLNKTTFRKKIYSRTWDLEQMPLEQFRYFPLTIYLKSFADLGYVENYPYYQENNFNTRLSNKLLAGAGAGIDIVTAYDAVFRLEYTFTREKTQGFFFHMKKEF
ncbi:MAG: BamA/TamA family outer membrane protein [Cyclobacteriaceae bacterium]|nr:BamA/TamA family outer membrane protein [Cyclobacteriaceae bacterium]